MKDFQNYTKDLLKLNPTLKFMYGIKDKESLSRIENSLDDNYLRRLKEISDKYRGSKDKELVFQVESIDFYLNNKLYLLLFSSVDNFIINFNYSTNNIYPENETYKNSRQRDFDIYVQTIIEKAKEGIRLNITFPKIIIKKFLNQIKHLEKYNKLYKFIKYKYLPYCRHEIGLCYLKNGKEIYKEIIKEYLGNLNITPEEIYQIGMDMSKNKINITDTYKSRDELFQDAIKYSLHIYNHIIDKYFHYKMDKPFVIKPVAPELEKISPLGYYNDTEKSVFINLSYYNEVNKSEIYSLLLHECFHYYHFSFMIFYNVPKYKYYIYSNDALAEGFAHYMETYNENYDENNIDTLIRKLRLIVDVGINYYGWTYKQSYDYLNKYLPNRKTDNTNEIDRYICIPGQALSYLIGKLHIIKLRDNYKGNIKDFHHELLINGMKKFN